MDPIRVKTKEELLELIEVIPENVIYEIEMEKEVDENAKVLP